MFISSILFSGSTWVLLIPVFIFAGIITSIIFYLKNSRPAWKKQTNLKKGVSAICIIILSIIFGFGIFFGILYIIFMIAPF